MKVVILAGGLGTRISEETDIKPKPMINIGDQPILWHIMKIYSYYGFNEFVILLGYKGYCIKEYFSNYFLHNSDVTFDLSNDSMHIHNNFSDPWKVTLINTGNNNMTGSRVKQAKPYTDNKPFFLTYGDGVSDIDITQLLEFHQSKGKALTVTAVQPEGRFGVLDIDNHSRVEKFYEKPLGDGGWINAGFFVCEQKVFDYISDDVDCIFEREPMENMAKDGELFGYHHHGFWKCMDTLRDKIKLSEMWENNKAKWKKWK
jgi:glucose-1-phosphate cytidylyltransferase